MKMIVVVALAVVAAVAAAPVDQPEPIKIVRSSYEPSPDGGYVSSYETANGITSEETGTPKKVLNEKNEEVTIIVRRGRYSYTSPDGVPVVVTYEADENGFRADGDSIPKAPVARR